MTLSEIESRLESIQKEQGMTYTTLDKAGLGYMLVKRIQQGEDYQVKFLFKYVDLLCHYMHLESTFVVGVWSRI